MSKHFVKMHGAGNDFIIVEPSFFNLSNERSKEATFTVEQQTLMKPEIISLCKHHFSVGADGCLVISQVDNNGYKMSVYNSDGSKGMMCGNGLRCVAVYLSKYKGLGQQFVVFTDGGDKDVNISKINNKLSYVNINLGQPSNYEKLQKLSEDHQASKYLQGVNVYCCSLGNNHIMIYLSEQQFQHIALDNAYQLIASDLRKLRHANVNFCCVESNDTIKIVTCQLGAGVTLACGTGSTASAFVAFREGLVQKSEVNMITKGGKIIISIYKKENESYQLHMNGPAEYIYSGTIDTQ